MRYLSNYTNYNESWKKYLAGALIGLTTACQKADIEDELGRKVSPAGINDIATVTYVDSIASDKFRVEAQLKNTPNKIYFDNPTRLDDGQTVYLRQDAIGRLLVTPVSPDFELPDEHSNYINMRLNFKGQVATNLGRWNKIKIDNSHQEHIDDLLKQLKELSSKVKSKYIAVQIDLNGNIVKWDKIKNLKEVKPRENLVILKGHS